MNEKARGLGFTLVFSSQSTSLSRCVSLCAVSAEPALGTARAKRLEENARSCRNCRHVYSFLAAATAVCVSRSVVSDSL